MTTEQRVGELRFLLSPCRLCPRECGADRLGGETGACRTGLLPRVASVAVHHGEEPPLSGSRGAGNVFFSGCNLGCRFCQNYPISQLGVGREVDAGELADRMLSLERRGVHLVNLVTASHVAPQAAEAVLLARGRGLSLPVAWNSNGYESLAALRLLQGIVDVWLPDLKYGDDGAARRCSGVEGYVAASRAAVDEMVSLAGPLETAEEGIARRGVIVRHLVLPDGLAGTRKVIEWLAATHPRVPLSLMSQYFPAHRAVDDPLLSRRLSSDEWLEAVTLFEESGLDGWVQADPGEECPCERFLEGCPGDGRCRRIA